MMGSRGYRGANECDAFSRYARHIRGWQRGEPRAVKRAYWKRARKAARQQARSVAKLPAPGA